LWGGGKIMDDDQALRASPGSSAKPGAAAKTGEWSAALARGAVFSALSHEGRARLAARGSVTTLAVGARLCAAGEAADAAYLVLAGELDISLTNAEGAVVWLARVGTGEVVGDMALLDGGPRSADITAARNTRLLRLGREAVLDALKSEPAAALDLLARLAGRLRGANGRLDDFATLDLGARLARLLLEAPGGVTARSQSELATLVGGARESVNRKLGQWRRAGLVSTGVFGVRVLSPERLRADLIGRSA